MEPSDPAIDVFVTSSCPDLGLVDAMARLQLAARRRGCVVQLRTSDPELQALIEFLGLGPALGLEQRRKPEGGEQLGIQEVVDPGDSTA